jgi:hypothetical protein
LNATATETESATERAYSIAMWRGKQPAFPWHGTVPKAFYQQQCPVGAVLQQLPLLLCLFRCSLSPFCLGSAPRQQQHLHTPLLLLGSCRDPASAWHAGWFTFLISLPVVQLVLTVASASQSQTVVEGGGLMLYTDQTWIRCASIGVRQRGVMRRPNTGKHPWRRRGETAHRFVGRALLIWRGQVVGAPASAWRARRASLLCDVGSL